MDFKPNRLSFEQGIERIKKAAGKFDKDYAIVTSRDEVAVDLRHSLKVTNVPPGFEKWQLPVWLEKPSQLYISVAAPNLKVPEHSHDEGAGVRIIMSGSIIFNGKELTEGDWMYIPQGKKYTFATGPLGARMCYCYCCSCA